MDLVNLKDDLEYFNATTLPRLEKALFDLTSKLDATISRLDGLTITINLKKEINHEDPFNSRITIDPGLPAGGAEQP